MTLEEKIRGLAAKGELVHISLVAKDGLFYANYAPASASGYAQGSHADPIAALEAAFDSSPVKPKRIRVRPEKEPDPVPSDQEPEAATEITAAVTGPAGAGPGPAGAVLTDEIIDTGFPTDWTRP